MQLNIIRWPLIRWQNLFLLKNTKNFQSQNIQIDREIFQSHEKHLILSYKKTIRKRRCFHKKTFEDCLNSTVVIDVMLDFNLRKSIPSLVVVNILDCILNICLRDIFINLSYLESIPMRQISLTRLERLFKIRTGKLLVSLSPMNILRC